jgi:hypothetical protein
MPMDNKGILADVNIPPDGTLGRYNGIGFIFSGGFLIYFFGWILCFRL